MKEVLISIRRTPYQSLSAFLVLFFTLFLSLTLFLFLSFLYGILGYLETRPQVTVYFQPKISESDIFKIRDELINSGKVLSIKYTSQSEAFKIYKELNKDNPLLLEMVSADILPPSLDIYAKKPVFLPEIAEYLKKQPGVDEVQFQKAIVDRLLTLTTILRRGTIVFFLFLLIMTMTVLMTTIHFKIALRKEEIELMKLLGASNFYIQKPFLLEGVFLATTASLASFAIILGIFFYFTPFLNSYLRGIPNLTLNLDFYQLIVWPINMKFLLMAFFLSTIFGITLTTLTNLLATRKYLH